ncbi:MAG: hypothetical protein K6F09_02145 [Clostridiales bacterium]|nr:hypothetical protein [Clostridiales bacterium]
MALYRIADINVEYEPRFDMLRERSKKYLIGPSDKVNFKISIKNDDPSKPGDNNSGLSDAECEYIAVGSSFYKGLISFNGLLLHASAVAYENEAYLFSAPCGTGKSTHTSIWQKHFGKDKAVIINDDKPAIRLVNGIPYVYGTPFSGQFDISENISVKLKAITFLHRSDINTIKPMDGSKAIYSFLNQTIKPSEPELKLKAYKTLDTILNSVPVFEMGCNMDEEAAEVAYKAMKEGICNED